MKFRLFTPLLLSMLFLSNGYAQDYRTWNLPDGATMRIGKGKIDTLKFSPDGSELAVATGVGIWMYSVATGDELALFTGHTAQIHGLVFSPDGKILASMGNDRTTRLWDTESGQQLALVFSAEQFSHSSIAFSPDGTIIVTGNWDGAFHTIQAWDVPTGDHLITIRGDKDYVRRRLVFSPDGKILAGSGEDSSSQLWDITTGKQLSTLTGQTLVFSPDGKILASISDNPSTPLPAIANDTPQESYRQSKSIHLLNLATGKHLPTLRGEALAFSPDGKILATADIDHTLQLWNPGTGEQFRTLAQPGRLDANQAPGRINRLMFSPDGSTLVSRDSQGRVELWNVGDGRLLSTTKAHAGPTAGFTLAFSRDEPILISDGKGGTIHTWHATTGVHLSTVTLEGHDWVWNRTLGFSADGTTLMSVGRSRRDSTVRFWDINGIKEFTPIVLPQSNVVNPYTFSPDGKILAGATDDMNTIKLWDLQTSSQLATLAGHTWFVETLVFSSDSSLLASGDREGAIYVWDTETGHRKKTLKGHPISVKSLTFSPDSSVLASASHESVRLWDTGTSTLRTTLIEQDDSGQPETIALVFSPDGRTLASTGRGKILLWDVVTHRLLSELARRGARVEVLAFSPDGAVLLTGCGDGTIEMWDTDTYTLKSTIKPHTERIEDLTFSPDGRTLASASMDGTILLWHWASLDP